MKKILLLGGAGYIGTAVTQKLLNNNYLVTCIDPLIYDNFYSIKKYTSDNNYEFINRNINSEFLTINFINTFDTVVILSGLVGDPITKTYPLLANDYNKNYIKNFIKKCTATKINKLIFISTCSNYGIIDDNDFADENYKLNPISEYAKAKIEVEEFLKSLKNKINFQTTILRFATAFGVSSRMRFDLTISHFIKDAFISNLLTIFDSKTWRPYCHVKDFANLINLVIENNKTYNFEIFNAGGTKNNYTKEIIAQKIKLKLPDLKIKYLEGDTDPRNYKVNFNKVADLFNFTPKYDLDYGINELLPLLEKKYFKFESSNINLYGNYNLDKLI